MVGDHICATKDEIEYEIVSFYKKLYIGTQWQRPRLDVIRFNQISNQHVGMLERAVLEEEIKEAVFGLGSNKSSGPDGFSLIFFQHF